MIPVEMVHDRESQRQIDLLARSCRCGVIDGHRALEIGPVEHELGAHVRRTPAETVIAPTCDVFEVFTGPTDDVGLMLFPEQAVRFP